MGGWREPAGKDASLSGGVGWPLRLVMARYGPGYPVEYSSFKDGMSISLRCLTLSTPSTFFKLVMRPTPCWAVRDRDKALPDLAQCPAAKCLNYLVVGQRVGGGGGSSAHTHRKSAVV